MNNSSGTSIGNIVSAPSGTYDTKIAGMYDLLDTLGSGHFAVVKLARHVFTGEKVAVKVIDKSKLDEVSQSHLFQEVLCMKLVQHPNVVRLYQVIDTKTKLYLILELGDGGDLYDYIMRHESGLSESQARDYFRQIVRAISYCHRLHVVHRDLKPENVVFFEKLGKVKLTDFGFSNKFCPGQKLETSCGSLAYSAPEILLGDSYDAPAVDVWSLGVILYMLVCGQPPFQEANDSETLTMIMDCKYTVPPYISNSCKRLIGRMLVREPEKRATLSEIATDPWVTAGEGVTIEDFDTPLVAKEQLSEKDRSTIIKEMVCGTIGTEEEILEALEKNEYNHITATYFLMAERQLRIKRQEQSRAARRPEALGVARAGARLLAPPALAAAPRTPQDVPPRSRKCSIVREEEDDEESGAGLVARGSRSEGRLHARAHALAPPAPAAAPPPRTTQLADHFVKVNLDDESSQSSKSDETTVIYCGGEGGAGCSAPMPRVPPPAPPPARRQRMECRRRRPRAGSCSSSDLSDDDSEKKKRAAERADLPADRPRRDSHDDSSDSQERGAGAGGRGGARAAPGGVAGAPGTDAGAGGAAGGAGGAAGDARGGGGRRRRAARKESRLRESRSLNRIAEVEEAAAARWAGGGLVALCGRPLLRLWAAARPAPPARRLHGLC
ncbi:SNF-related serine/threonine-protein kinase [Amyelois transitella]|uniref:SNF-related serine/threonine-protein kinase n=1 Tax=Amyelois transitella TaxID=680683 RepID=UPI00298F5845|nr:SNF-related serine/threonine-protein kinase [Amyelois transitella]